MTYNLSIFNEETWEDKRWSPYNIGDWTRPLYIPREYAREESDQHIRNQEDIEKIDHYTLYLFRQSGRSIARKDTYILCELPSGKRVKIILYPDDGVSFDKDERVYLLREYDALDRRILLGFCKKYRNVLINESHNDKNEISRWLRDEASWYKASMMPKRIKQGRGDTDFTDFYHKHKWLEPSDESANIGSYESEIFRHVVII